MNEAPIFVAYVHADRERIEPMLQVLIENGLTLWRDDQNIQPGEQWATAIGRALQAAPKVVAFVTRKAMQSRWFISELHAAFIQNKLVWVQLDEIDTHDFPIDISQQPMLMLQGKDEWHIKHALAELAQSLKPKMDGTLFSLAEDRIEKAVFDRWRESIPTRLLVGQSVVSELSLEISELGHFLTSNKIEQHPVFGVQGRDPTLKIRLIALTNGVSIQNMNDDVQWVSNFAVADEADNPIVWRRHVLAESPGAHRILMQLYVLGADESGITVEHPLFERSFPVLVRESWSARGSRVGLWAANSVAAGIIGFVVAEMLR